MGGTSRCVLEIFHIRGFCRGRATLDPCTDDVTSLSGYEFLLQGFGRSMLRPYGDAHQG